MPPAVDSAELLRHRIRPELILPYWDELLRLAASLRHGWAPVSLLLARLQAGSRRNPLAQALQEYGRLVKTNFVLAWLADEELRQRVGRQLNKASSSTRCAARSSTPTKGTCGSARPNSRPSRRCALAIIVNATIAWNTVYIGRVIDELRAHGELITTSELEHISPLAHQHIHLYGHYPFDLATRPDGHRPSSAARR